MATELHARPRTEALPNSWSSTAHKAFCAVLEHHQADQLIVPLAFMEGTSQFSVDRISGHFKSHAWLVEEFDLASVTSEKRQDDTGHVRTAPKGTGS